MLMMLYNIAVVITNIDFIAFIVVVTAINVVISTDASNLYFVELIDLYHGSCVLCVVCCVCIVFSFLPFSLKKQSMSSGRGSYTLFAAPMDKGQFTTTYYLLLLTTTTTTTTVINYY